MNGLIGLGLLIAFILLLIFGMRLIDFGGHFAPRPEPPKPPKTEPEPEPEDSFEAEVKSIVAAYDERPPADPAVPQAEVRFREIALGHLEPMLDGVVGQATHSGHHAGVERSEENGALRYRLEIRRSDHLAGEPLPYILFHTGEKKDVAVLIGGTFPGRKAENSHRTEIDWFEIDWKDVDETLLKFTRRVFHHFDN